MPHCENCGSAVSRRYVDVFEPAGRDTARCCPECDVVRDGPGVRDAYYATGGAD